MANAEDPKHRQKADDKAAGEEKGREEKPGKFHYNPVNMSGKDAGIVDEVLEDVNDREGRESAEDDPAKGRRGDAPDRG
jgi:hypothetical protein